MRNRISKALTAGLAALSLTASVLATAEPAAARYWHGGGWHGGGWHGGWHGPRGHGRRGLWGPPIAARVAARRRLGRGGRQPKVGAPHPPRAAARIGLVEPPPHLGGLRALAGDEHDAGKETGGPGFSPFRPRDQEHCAGRMLRLKGEQQPTAD